MLTASRLLRSARPAQTSRLTSAFHSSSPVKSETKEVEGGGFMGTSLSPLFAIPAGIFAAIPMIQNQWLVLDAESQLVGCFAAFVLIAYTQGGDAIAKSLDDRADAVQAEHNLIEDANIGAVQATIDAHKKRVAMIQVRSVLRSTHTLHTTHIAHTSLTLCSHIAHTLLTHIFRRTSPP